MNLLMALIFFKVASPKKLSIFPVTICDQQHVNDKPSNFDAFVVPKLPSPPVMYKPFPIFEDDQPAEKAENQCLLYNQNESMCTMNFNQCIETGSMSTPIKMNEKRSFQTIEKKENPEYLTDNEFTNEINQQNISPITQATDQENGDFVQMPKQLSTIMETTETTSSTGLHTKSTIGSPENITNCDVPIPNTNQIQTRNIEKVAITKTISGREEKVTENGFPSETENMKTVSLKAPLYNFADDSKLLAEKSVMPSIEAFSIFEDRTENLKAVSLQEPTLTNCNVTEVVNKENISRLVLTESLPLSAYNNYIDNDTSTMKKLRTLNSTLSHDESTQHVSNEFKNLLIQNEKPTEIVAEKSDVFPEIRAERGSGVGENSMLGMSVLQKSKVQTQLHVKDREKTCLKPYENSGIQRTSDQFYDTFCRSPVKSQSVSHLEKTSNWPMFAKQSKTVSIPPAVCNNESPKKPVIDIESTSIRNSIDFYDLFSKSPEKTGTVVNKHNIVEQGLHSPVVSIFKIDSINSRDTTQDLLKLNLDDNTHPFIMGKGQNLAARNNNSLLHESQIKQEISLHITDRLSTYKKPSLQLPVNENTTTQLKKPLFAEDENINTWNFASNLCCAQNSTFIAPLENDLGNRKTIQIMDCKPKAIEKKKSAKNVRLSHIENEDVFINDTPVSQHKENEQESIEIKRDDFSKDAESERFITIETPKDDLGVSIYGTTKSYNAGLHDEHWDEVNEDFDIHADTNQYLANTIDLDGTRAFIHDQLLEEIVNPFDKALTNALLDQIDFISYLRDIQTCSLKNKICQLTKGKTVEFGNETFDIIKVIGKGAYGVVFS